MSLAHHLGALAAQDVEVSHDELFKYVRIVLRAVNLVVLILNPIAHLIMSLLGYIHVDIYEYATATFMGMILAGSAAYAKVASTPCIFEINAFYILTCAFCLVMSAYQAVATFETKQRDLIVHVVIWPLASLLIMSVKTILKVAGSRVAYESLWITSCIALNGTMVYKCFKDLPSLLPLLAAGVTIQVFVGFLLHLTTTAVMKERDVLKDVRSVLRQNLEAQDTMWRSVFDATIILDSIGQVTRISPQVQDLLQAESEDSIVGCPLSKLACSDDEVERVGSFVNNALESALNQAMTIQSTFSTGNGEHVDIQLNAVKVVQDVRDLSSPLASGLMLGMRAIASGTKGVEEMTTTQACVPAGASSGSSSDDLEQNQDMCIFFDAGDIGFPVSKCPAELWDTEPSLLDWMPRKVRNEFEQWVLDEVDVADEIGGLSSRVIENVKLRIQPKPVTVAVKGMRLETMPAEVKGNVLSFPTKLWLQGVQIHQHLRHGYPVKAEPMLSPVPEMLEQDDHEEKEGKRKSLDLGGDISADDAASAVSDICPSDSASQVGGLRLVASRSSGSSAGLTFRPRIAAEDV